LGTTRDVVAHARDVIASADRTLVLTGAGISAESGVPTFRGPEGLWKTFRPEELATPSAFARDPRLVWEWYDWRRRTVRACRPNAAHVALANLALRRGSARTRIVTQNVDGLHAVAARESATRGVSTSPHAALPLELHGSLFRVRCTSCGERREHDDPIDASSPDSLPRCAGCSALLRPDIVWFGEALDDGVLGEALERARTADVCLVVGTSALVQPAASVATTAVRAGAALVEVNAEETPLSRLARVTLRGAAGTIVPAILEGTPTR
jgi:NAD-dependent deacetylase